MQILSALLRMTYLNIGKNYLFVCPLLINMTTGYFFFMFFFYSSADCFQNQFKKKKFQDTTRVSNSLDIDQARRFVGPDLVPNCLQKDITRRH